MSPSLSLSQFLSQIKIGTVRSTCSSSCRQLVSFSAKKHKREPRTGARGSSIVLVGHVGAFGFSVIYLFDADIGKKEVDRTCVCVCESTVAPCNTLAAADAARKKLSIKTRAQNSSVTLAANGRMKLCESQVCV